MRLASLEHFPWPSEHSSTALTSRLASLFGLEFRAMITLAGASFTMTQSIVVVKNNALLGNHQFTILGITLSGSQSHPTVETYLTGSYAITKKLGPAMTIGPWLSNIGVSTFVYISTHGVSDFYSMNDASEEQGNVCDDNSGDDHKLELIDTVGSSFTATTYPPFNPSEQPPPSFVFIDACKVFQADFSWTLYPKVNLYDGSGIPRTKNCFTAGFTVSAPTSLTEPLAEKLCLELFYGTPALRALNATADWCKDKEWKDSDGNIITRDSFNHHGDPYTKVKGVYTANGSLSLAWWSS